MTFLSTTLFDTNWIGVFFVLILTYIARFYYRYLTRENPLPGPIPLPLIGNLHQMGDVAKWITKLQSQYGDMWEVYMGSERCIWLGNGYLIKNMLNSSTKTIYFNRSSYNEGVDELGMHSNGMLMNRNVESYQFNRKIVSKCLMSSQFLQEFVNDAQELFNQAENYWSNLGYDAEMDFAPWMKRFTADLTIKATTGKNAHALTAYYNTLAPKDKRINSADAVFKQSENFLQNILRFISALQYFMFIPKWMRYYIPGLRQYTKKTWGHLNDLNNEMVEFINKKQEEIEKTPLHEPLPKDLLTLLLIANTERDPERNAKDKRTLEINGIRQNLLEIFCGGMDSSANAFCYMIYFLDKNPACKARLIKEIKTVIGTDYTQPLTQSQLDRLVYCEAVLKECLRLIPIVAFTFRESSAPDIVGGYKWPAGTMFYQHYGGIHRHPAHWGKDAEEFKPERFLNQTIENNVFLPFGGGLKMCPGRRAATLGLKVCIVLLYSKYHVKLAHPDEGLHCGYTMAQECHEMKVLIKPK